MTAQEAIDKYTKKFGGWPGFLMMGASDERIVEVVKEALRTGEEISPGEGLVY